MRLKVFYENQPINIVNVVVAAAAAVVAAQHLHQNHPRHRQAFGLAKVMRMIRKTLVTRHSAPRSKTCSLSDLFVKYNISEFFDLIEMVSKYSILSIFLFLFSLFPLFFLLRKIFTCDLSVCEVSHTCVSVYFHSLSLARGFISQPRSGENDDDDLVETQKHEWRISYRFNKKSHLICCQINEVHTYTL